MQIMSQRESEIVPTGRSGLQEIRNLQQGSPRRATLGRCVIPTVDASRITIFSRCVFAAGERADKLKRAPRVLVIGDSHRQRTLDR